MADRYIGSKARVVDAIMDAIGGPVPGSAFVDPFCGTGAVSEAAAQRGWTVRAGDLLASAVIATAARLASRDTAPFVAFGGYDAAIGRLAAVPDVEGFIWRSYSPASAATAPVERRYFTEANARRIDGMRAAIRKWLDEGSLTGIEADLLVADLMAAANRVANIAGTYGCFLRRWQKGALRPIDLRSRVLRPTAPPFTVAVGDASAATVGSSDVLYLDPPYTKRQYAAYYHVLETIAHGDEPLVEGVAGIRPWRHAASSFCYKAKALDALAELIERHPARQVFLSYSDEGHMPLEALRARLDGLGKVSMAVVGEIGRYRPNRTASAARSEVSEVLFRLDRDEAVSAERRVA